MAERRPFLLRVDKDVLDAIERWADDDLRSVNAQIEFLLRRVLQAEGRLRRSSAAPDDTPKRRAAASPPDEE